MPSPILPICVRAYTSTSAIGVGRHAWLSAIQSGRGGLRANCYGPDPLPSWVGQVDGLDAPLPSALKTWDCRNNRLAWLGLLGEDFLAAAAKSRERFGAARVGVVMGTSTSSIGATEEAYTQLDDHGRFPAFMAEARLHTLHSLSAFVQEALGLSGPCLTLSTACSSSAKAFAVAERWLRLDLADAVVVGGVDTLCGSVLYGFHALQLLSPDPCTPFDLNRRGINLGEAAAYALLERGEGALQLLGYGEASDAHHLSAPHPQALGAEQALDDALQRAGLEACGVDYLHLHGTASRQNDAVEAALVARRFSSNTHASSTKGWVGHTLGTAGGLGAVVCLLAIETGWMPGTANTQALDPGCGPQIKLSPKRHTVRTAAAHAFGFGGSNCVLLFGAGGIKP